MVAFSTRPTAVERLTQRVPQRGSTAAAENARFARARTLMLLKSLVKYMYMHPRL